MQRFMQEKNLSLFLRRLLAEQKEMDEERRQVIFKLLAEEEAKDAIDRVSQRAPVGDFHILLNRARPHEERIVPLPRSNTRLRHIAT